MRANHAMHQSSRFNFFDKKWPRDIQIIGGLNRTELLLFWHKHDGLVSGHQS
jgi:hypothetical protein